MTSVLWRMQAEPLLEFCRLSEEAGQNCLEGAVVGRWEAQPLTVQYQLTCSPQWTTQHVRVDLLGENTTRSLELTVDNELRWWRLDRELREFRGVTDVDLQITPCTNTLPIRRLNLAIGQSAEVRAVWIRFPQLELELLEQRYTRTGRNTYAYESDGGAFQAHLEVDDHGLIVRYGDLWKRA